MKLGVIASSGGGVLRELLLSDLPNTEFMVITDRPCGAERVSLEFGVRQERIEADSNQEFSELAARRLEMEEVDCIFLFFSRLVTAALYGYRPTINFHPSLLPAFPGLHALKRARDRRVRFFGATAHRVDGSVDGGPILAQVCVPYAGEFVDRMEEASFIQKTYLAYVLWELWDASGIEARSQNRTKPRSDRANPSLQDSHLRGRIAELQDHKGLFVFP